MCTAQIPQMIAGSEDRIPSLSILFSITEIVGDDFSALWEFTRNGLRNRFFQLT
jgi:hypothetical protein